MCSVREAADAAHARYSSARACLVEAVAELGSSGAWRGDGAGSLAAWLASRWQISYPTARELVEQAEALRARPAILAALAEGTISQDQCKALTTLSREGTDDDEVWAECVGFWSLPELQREARKATARELERRDDGVYLRMSHTADERFVRGRFQLHPEDGAAVMKALEAHIPTETKLKDWDRAMADALVRVASEPPGRGSRVRPTVVVSIDAATLVGSPDSDGVATLDSNTIVGPETARRLACDSVVQQLIRDAGGAVVGIGRRSRQIPADIRRAVHVRDGERCVFDGCPHTEVQLHHVDGWAEGGRTDIDNLVGVCSVHHKLVHEGGWSLRGPAGRHMQWVRPDGTIHQPRVRVTLDTS